MWCRRAVTSIPKARSRFIKSRLRDCYSSNRFFSSYNGLYAVRPFMLADIGEGIKECEVIQWFVEPGATIEEFDPICEVQSDKASVEITSRFSGVIKQLHYEVGEMALVGKPLIDIDVVDGDEPAVAAAASTPTSSASSANSAPASTGTTGADTINPSSGFSTSAPTSNSPQVNTSSGNSAAPAFVPFDPSLATETLATPAVRRICRELGFSVSDIKGSGKDGRVLKEDVLNHSKTSVQSGQQQQQTQEGATASAIPSSITNTTLHPLTPIQKQMFKTMTNSLTIPHFLYTDEVEIDRLSALRKSINEDLIKHPTTPIKLSFMPFFIKALSLALTEYPILNAQVVIDEKTSQPALLYRESHNIGVAMDTPSGLIVPNIKNVNNLSIIQIGQELTRLQQLGASGKLTSADIKDGTITLSNIGTVGGTYVAPVIVGSEVAIGGLGKSHVVPRYDAKQNLVPRTIINSSWSGDHRVIDGVTMARMVARWKAYVEHPEKMLVSLK
ncbi:alpha-ketoglutarate dehydrogenase KGD2 [Sugiyamaella lignohabitans]|uniref:Dihydrolipoamide acetyltransferase component of pyruvate dehydrogenase complex n=1 Tax=Sugiyamaella lignohabitans TaxID=796027 RepID=A0A167E496_9ASCO|nr:alpha-ketoglutarate dehydrogenase KGD2 [Sugiyamaella lignohabitans]ANB13624.1 alpha-ketoglutarate dehydrogenase KGD2 [Sugiyamaella lignohabitans]